MFWLLRRSWPFIHFRPRPVGCPYCSLIQPVCPALAYGTGTGLSFAHSRGRLPVLACLLPILVVVYRYHQHTDTVQIFLSAMFRATARLLDCRIIFFTRSPCGLCDTAKAVVQSVQAKRPLEYKEINVMDPGQEEWKNLYEFDTPVVRHHAFVPVGPST
ncbi:hypothetical protein IAQ61_006221 [Plenodomus lingam]|uniref:uncharacterized protein n=1 Tax=Leptosphaeria maculans TaxID=5022 RepID=UPI0033183C07|nr:hypothetical protein IAQ61_006221 [Plenodomus lingam]